MADLKDIEELFKSQDLIKSKAMVHALLRHAAKYHDPKSSAEDKQMALEQIKMITAGKKQKQPKQPKEPKQPKQPKIPFHEEFAQHHGADPVKFKAAFDAMSPDQQKLTMNWHKEQVAAKMKKSVEHLYNLFKELKKHI